MRWRRPSIKPSKFGTVYKKDCGECFVLRSFFFRRDRTLRAIALSVFLFCNCPQTGSVCPSDGVPFSFVSKRKRNQKERELRACALKNPLIVQSFCAQSKTSCLPFSQLQVPLRRTLSRFARGNLYEVERKTKCRGNHRSRLRRALPRNTNSDGRNSISPYFCYVDIEILMRNRAFPSRGRCRR